MDRFYTCEEVAERYKVQHSTVWSWIRSNTIPAIKIGRLYRIREADLEAFEQANLAEKE